MLNKPCELLLPCNLSSVATKANAISISDWGGRCDFSPYQLSAPLKNLLRPRCYNEVWVAKNLVPHQPSNTVSATDSEGGGGGRWGIMKRIVKLINKYSQLYSFTPFFLLLSLTRETCVRFSNCISHTSSSAL